MNFPRIVYAIRHEPTGKIYVGSTHDLCSRLNSHLAALKGGYHKNEAMQKDCNERGFSYSVFVLDFVTNFQDRNKEFLWIDALRTRLEDVGYNAGNNSNAAVDLLRDGFLIGDDCSIRAIQQLAKKCKKLREITGKSTDYLLGLVEE